MFEEREILVKQIFPQLRKLCEGRGVAWGEVDLRWGVTDEQKAEGKVLPICLEEIKRCRPYFIGILGERYGSLPEEIPQELVDREPWLKEHLQHSLTELEIWHGVLRNPEMADHAFFYFRDPGYTTHLPKGRKPGDFAPESEMAKAKLSALKDRIRESGLPVRESYKNPKSFGQLVLDDLTRVIDDLYPEGSQPDQLDRDAADHEAFARSRARIYIGREKYFRRLDEHTAGDDQPLVVLGESGSGKSALLANWALKYRTEHPNDLLIIHFIGASPYSSDWAAMLRRIMGEFKRKFGIAGDIPDKPDALRLAFANWLGMASAKGRVFLILDALNQLEDRDGAPDLVWLPPVVPANIRLFLSTLPGRPLDDLKKRSWLTLEVQPFNVQERSRFIRDYLALYTKALNPAQAERIAREGQAANPLFLQALLDELRLFGIYEQLNERIELYVKAPTIPALYELILARYEEDYEADRAGLVRDATTALWAARRGLSETELMDLLGSDGNPLPRAFWSPLYLAAESALTSRSGLVGFFHDYFRDAVRSRYLPKPAQQNDAHLRLAGYFEKQEQGPRRIDELPWQLTEAKSWRRLYDLLADLDFFEAVWNVNEFDLKAYWAHTEANSELRMIDAYSPAIKKPRQVRDTNQVWNLGFLLSDTGHLEEALSFRKFLTEHFRKTGDQDNYRASLGNQALILKARGDLDAAMALHREQERICRELGNKDGLSISLGNQALILKARGDLDAAMALLKEQERICRELRNPDGLATSLTNQSLIQIQKGKKREALSLAKEAYELATRHGLSALAQQIKPILDIIQS
jgi:nephrocystin-3